MIFYLFGWMGAKINTSLRYENEGKPANPKMIMSPPYSYIIANTIRHLEESSDSSDKCDKTSFLCKLNYSKVHVITNKYRSFGSLIGIKFEEAVTTHTDGSVTLDEKLSNYRSADHNNISWIWLLAYTCKRIVVP